MGKHAEGGQLLGACRPPAFGHQRHLIPIEHVGRFDPRAREREVAADSARAKIEISRCTHIREQPDVHLRHGTDAALGGDAM